MSAFYRMWLIISATTFAWNSIYAPFTESHKYIDTYYSLYSTLVPPEVSLHLGANIKYSTIKEGNDVYLECIIKANPPVTELVWFFNEVPFYGNASGGIIISNQSLVLQKVRKEHRGRYKCLASNTEGQGQSQDLLLEVRCKYFGT